MNEQKSSVEKLFAEDFKPAWMIQKEKAVQQSISDAEQAEVDFAWQHYAHQKMSAIARKWRKASN